MDGKSARFSANLMCDNCGKKFLNLYNLRRHCKNFHPDHPAPLLQSKNKDNYKYQCFECQKYFNNVHKFNYHNKNKHLQEQVLQQKKTIQCALCEHGSSTKIDMIKHFEEHNVNIEIKNMEFSSLAEFSKWKSSFEAETMAKFVLEKSEKSKQRQTFKYMCHRSGFYKPKGRGERHLKTIGSQKMNGFCPAGVKLIIDEESKCHAQVIITHVGHHNEIQHIQLTQQERKSLAMKLAAKVPFNCILDEIRGSVEGADLKRIHLLNKKDLHNIEKSFNLSSDVVTHFNDAVSLESWIDQVEDECVLFYKPQNIINVEHPELESKDFVLILMNSSQIDMVKMYGSNCVCLDGTHGLNSYSFEMNTLLVLDDMRQEFPCAFLVSNRSDEIVFKVFFSYIKQYTGCIEPKILMSDMADTCYNAWTNVMTTPKLRLYYTWHVDKAWRKNLSKINTKEKQSIVYKLLRTILQMTDQRAFNEMIDKLYSDLLLDDDTKLFASYFKDNYMNIATRWAHCHRLQPGLNTNMHIEKTHRTIKHIYLKGKKVKRFDKSLHALMRFVRDKFFDMPILINEEKITSKVQFLQERHQESLKLDKTMVLGNGEQWDIPSGLDNNFEMYHLEKIKDTCDCNLICSDCDVCLHMYSCSCIDSSVRWNMCKHIHLLCSCIKEKAKNEIFFRLDKLVLEENEISSMEVDTMLGEKRAHCESILTELNRNQISQEKTIEEDKRDVLDMLQKLIERVHNTNSPSKLKLYKKLLAPISPTMDALENDRSNVKFVTQLPTFEPSNKKNTAHRTTKKPVKKKNVY